MIGVLTLRRRRGLPVRGDINVCVDGVRWRKRSEEHRRAVVGVICFDAIVVGPRCWRLTARRDGVEVLRRLASTLNRCKFLAALFVREQRL